MQTFTAAATPTTTSDVQGEETVHNSLDYLINSLKTEEDVTLSAAVMTMSTGRGKGILIYRISCC